MSDDIKSLLREILRDEFSEVRGTITEFQNELAKFREDTAIGLKKLDYVLESLDKRMETIDENHEEMSKSLDKIEHDHERRDRKISSIIVQYQHLESFIGNEMKRLAAINDKQKTIDLLSARSIQHEVDIRELNRVFNN